MAKSNPVTTKDFCHVVKHPSPHRRVVLEVTKELEVEFLLRRNEEAFAAYNQTNKEIFFRIVQEAESTSHYILHMTTT